MNSDNRTSAVFDYRHILEWVRNSGSLGLSGRIFRVLVIIFAESWLTSCESPSDVGNQPNSEPVAIITVIGNEFQQNGDTVTTTARSQGLITISGKESFDLDEPILSFDFRLVPNEDAEASQIKIFQRSRNTFAFFAPKVSETTDLQFLMDIENSTGQTASARLVVTVLPVLDGERTMEYMTNPSARLTVVAGVAAVPGGVPANSKVMASGSAMPVAMQPIDYELIVTRQLSYLNSAGQRATIPSAGLTVFPGTWTVLPDTIEDATSDNYPRHTLRIPFPNIDDINQSRDVVNSIDAKLQLSDLDTIVQSLDFRIQDPATNGPHQNVEVELYILGTGDQEIARWNSATGIATINTDGTGDIIGVESLQLTITDEVLIRTEDPERGVDFRETAASAKAYYDAIDPGEDKLTLSDWLTYNCFDPEDRANNFDADAHATYTNNYDLGFGRDMYVRTSNCGNGFFSEGDVAAVVINHLNVEGAVKKQRPNLAVAMEYATSEEFRTNQTPSPNGRYTRFYVFAPDERDGSFKRVLSADLDGRGERYLPGACTMCHGGSPKLGAQEIAKQLRSEPRPDEIKYPNSGDIHAVFIPWDVASFVFTDTDRAFSTNPIDENLRSTFSRTQQEPEFLKMNQAVLDTYPVGHESFAALRAFLCRSYDQDADCTELPQGRSFLDDIVPEPDLWLGSEDLYVEVFARHCRTCHLQMWDQESPYIAGPQFRAALDLIGHSELISSVYREGVMPAARLTMDRFWDEEYTEGSPAGTLAAAISAAQGIPDNDLRPPGVPRLDLRTETAIQARSQPVVVLSEDSSFADTIDWKVVPESLNPPDSRFECEKSTPVIVAKASDRFVFLPDLPCKYTVTATASNSAGFINNATRDVIIKNLFPKTNPINVARTIAGPTTLSETVKVFERPGDGSPRQHSLGLFESTNPDLVSLSGISETRDANGVPSVQIETNSGATGITEIRYVLLDVDGDPAYGSFTVNVSTDLVAPPITLEAELDGAAVPIDLGNLAVEARSPFPNIVVKCGMTSLLGATGLRGTAQCADNGDLQYTPPIGRMSHFEGNAVSHKSSPSEPDSFEYQICLEGDPESCSSPGMVQVRLQGSKGFNATFMDGGGIEISKPITGCIDCHAAERKGSKFVISDDSVGNYCAFVTDAEADPAAGLLGDRPNIDNTSFVDVINPTSSLLYLKPKGENEHGGGKRITDEEASDILQWITEGAYYTDSDSVDCP